jgi:hypothetical protein
MRIRSMPLACLVAVIGAAVTGASLGWLGLGTQAAHAGSAISSSSPNRMEVAAQAAPPPPTLRAPADPGTVTVPDSPNLFSWALYTKASNTVTGSANRETSYNTVESMIKAWITSDYLRHQGTAAVSSATLSDLTRMIELSDDNMASKYYAKIGGDASITELGKVCGLANVRTPYIKGEWSYTTITAADAVRMGQCVQNGTAAGPTWTNWVLTTMRNVKGSVTYQQLTTGGGHWGIIDGLPASMAATTSIKNGWTAQLSDHRWHINCLAINTDWVLVVQLQYPWTSPNGAWQSASNLSPAADMCKAVAQQLVYQPDI